MPKIKLSQQEIEQVIVNLILNASDALADCKEKRIIVRSQQKDNAILLEIEDSGTGIPEDKLESIWNPFFTTKEIGKGTGLGLSISLGIIKDHGGELIAKNVDTGGALFRITLPLAEINEVKNED